MTRWSDPPGENQLAGCPDQPKLGVERPQRDRARAQIYKPILSLGPQSDLRCASTANHCSVLPSAAHSGPTSNGPNVSQASLSYRNKNFPELATSTADEAGSESGSSTPRTRTKRTQTGKDHRVDTKARFFGLGSRWGFVYDAASLLGSRTGSDAGSRRLRALRRNRRNRRSIGHQRNQTDFARRRVSRRRQARETERLLRLQKVGARLRLGSTGRAVFAACPRVCTGPSLLTTPFGRATSVSVRFQVQPAARTSLAHKGPSSTRGLS